MEQYGPGGTQVHLVFDLAPPHNNDAVVFFYVERPTVRRLLVGAQFRSLLPVERHGPTVRPGTRRAAALERGRGARE